jgi:hypothetical protein
MFLFRCDRCKRLQDPSIPNSEPGGVLEYSESRTLEAMMGIRGDVTGENESGRLEVCSECYNNYFWWKGNGEAGSQRDAQTGPAYRPADRPADSEQNVIVGIKRF